MTKAPFLLCAISMLLFAACGKEEIDLPWQELSSPINTRLNSISFIDKNNGHIIGGDVWNYGVHLTTNDGGEQWQVDTFSTKMLNRYHFSEANGKSHAVGISGLFQKTSLNTPWFQRGIPVTESLPPLNDVEFRADGQGILVGGLSFGSGVIIQLNNVYQVLSIHRFDNEISAVTYLTDEVVIAVGFGMILRSEDGGNTWTRLSVDSDFYRAIHFPSPTIGYAIGSGGTIVKTSDSGRTWEKLRDGDKFGTSDEPFRSVFFADEDKGYIVGEGGLFWQTIDGGNNWKQIKGFPNVDLHDIYVIEDKGYIVGLEGRIFEFSN